MNKKELTELDRQIAEMHNILWDNPTTEIVTYVIGLATGILTQKLPDTYRDRLYNICSLGWLTYREVQENEIKKRGENY